MRAGERHNLKILGPPTFAEAAHVSRRTGRVTNHEVLCRL